MSPIAKRLLSFFRPKAEGPGQTLRVGAVVYARYFVAAGVLIVLMGTFHRLVNPQAADPFWLRLLVAGVGVGLGAGALASQTMQDNVSLLWRGYLFGVMTWFTCLFAWNGFIPEYAVGFIVLVCLITLGMGLGLRTAAPIFGLFVYLVVLLTGAALTVEPWRTSAVVVIPASLLVVAGIGISLLLRMQAWRALEVSEERWLRLVDKHPETITVTVDTDIVYINDSGLELLDVDSREKLLGRSLLDYVTEERREDLAERLAALRRGSSVEPEEYVFRTAGGDRRQIEVMAVPVRFNERSAAQSVLRDITEQRRWEEELIAAKEEAEEMHRLKSAFLSIISHEVRTPLTSILGFADMLLVDATGEQRDFAELIRRSGKRLLDTLNSILDLSKIEAGSVELREENFDAVDRVRQTVEIYRPIAADKDVDVTLSTSADSIHVTMDHSCFDRTVTNLVSNAVKFTDEGSVDVAIEATEQEVTLHVEDTGIGIDEEFLPHLFDAFQQESEGLDRSHEGSGLGLTITKYLVELMDGSLSVESEKGRGSRFTAVFPRMINGR